MADLVKRLDYSVNCTLLSQAKARLVKESTLLPPRSHILREAVQEDSAF